jgi:hypothetical protein
MPKILKLLTSGKDVRAIYKKEQIQKYDIAINRSGA